MEVLKEKRVADKDFENVQRWTARRRTALVLQIVKGKVRGTVDVFYMEEKPELTRGSIL